MVALPRFLSKATARALDDGRSGSPRRRKSRAWTPPSPPRTTTRCLARSPRRRLVGEIHDGRRTEYQSHPRSLGADCLDCSCDPCSRRNLAIRNCRRSGVVRGREEPSGMRVRIASGPAKVGYVVLAYIVMIVAGIVVAVAGWPAAAQFLMLALGIASLLFAVRTFRGPSESLSAPRAWWRMTERPV